VTSPTETQGKTDGKRARRLPWLIRPVDVSDASAIWRLVDQCSTLDKNSCYAYLLLCSDFADTCLAAYAGDELVGFILGYVPPKREDVLFVWQVGVSRSVRGQGLGKELLGELTRRAVARGTRYLEATVTPGNVASKRLFCSLAASRECEFATFSHFQSHHFASSQHDEELLYRIGPL
jgi:L-2,4-diaminobutyric acid acetyltransferase